MLFTIGEVALAAGVSRGTMEIHRKIGLCPEPDANLGLQRIYTEEGKQAVIAYFQSRPKWGRENMEHQKKGEHK